MSTIYTLPNLALKTLKGQDFSLNELQGKAFNTASKCGYTNQLKGLEALYQKHKAGGLEIIAFPSNEFGGQEPGTATEIQEFCERNYSVKFPIMEKTKVNGDEAHPLYQFFQKEKPGPIKWNFEKFLIDRQGKVVSRFPSSATPESLEAEIAKLL